ncbi:MAG TPA: iron-containing alcohol dehydrogenase [Geobacteraceae bacterium]|nr:iron-containing alcohol dehydrogenase [Geobacteraceae bacterium]
MNIGKGSMHHCKFEVPEIIFGRGLLNQIGSCARRLGGHKVFLVSDQGLFSAGWVDKALKYIMDAGLEVILYDNITSNPKDVEIETGALEYVRHGADVIIGLGGGQCHGCRQGCGDTGLQRRQDQGLCGP